MKEILKTIIFVGFVVLGFSTGDISAYEAIIFISLYEAITNKTA